MFAIINNYHSNHNLSLNKVENLKTINDCIKFAKEMFNPYNYTFFNGQPPKNDQVVFIIDQDTYEILFELNNTNINNMEVKYNDYSWVT